MGLGERAVSGSFGAARRDGGDRGVHLVLPVESLSSLGGGAERGSGMGAVG